MDDYDFNERVAELKFYIESIDRLNNLINLSIPPNPYSVYFKKLIDQGNNNLDSSVFLTISKSNALVMMYNFIEATIKQCISDIYTDINQKDLTYNELSDEYKKLFRKYNYTSLKGASFENIQKIKELSLSLLNDVIKEKSVHFYPEKFSLSGNADLRTVKEIYKNHSIDINDTEYGQELLFIKNSRNDLAHGSKTFSSIGKTIPVKDIKQYSEDVISFLSYLVKETHKFIQYKRYKKRN